MLVADAFDRPVVDRTTPHLAYRPDIDGLRAIAVLAVVLYHADVAPFGGGFVGVDVFFVISGFLITGNIHRDIAQKRFSYAQFYERRIRRIFPALVATALATSALAAVILIPTDFRHFGRSLLAMAVFASNLFFSGDVGATGYFHVTAQPPLLIHTWSLAVEEQFYIILPPLMLLLRRRAPRLFLPALVACTALSFAAAVVLTYTLPSTAFYAIGSRAWELLIGSLLAVAPLPRLPSRILRWAVAPLGLLLIAVAVFGFSDKTPFPGFSALLPCLGAWLVIHRGEGEPNAASRLLAWRPIVFIGRISYSLYLWHWPVIAAVKHLTMGHLTAPLTIFAIALSLILAVLSFAFIETPFRRRPATVDPRRSERRVLAAGLGTIVVLLALGGFAVLADGWPGRFSPALQTLIAGNVAREDDYPVQLECENFGRPVASMRDLNTCPISNGEAKNILFWGDSHVEELWSVVKALHTEGALDGRGAVFAVAPTCAPSLTLDKTGLNLHCERVARASFDRAREPDIDTVFILYTGWRTSYDDDECRPQANGGCIPVTKKVALDTVSDEIAGYARALRAQGKHVIIGLSDPTYRFRLPRYQITRAMLSHFNLLKPLERYDFEETRERLTAVARETGATTYDARAGLCPEPQVCRYEENGISIYTDDNHVAKPRVRLFHDPLRDALQASWATPRP